MRTSRMLKTVVLVAALLCPVLAQAGNTLTIEPQFALGIPMDDWADGAGLGLGGMVKVEFAVLDTIGVGFRAGYIHHLEKNDITWGVIPLVVSGKYKTPFGLFGELGLGMFVHRVDTPMGDDSKSKFGFTVGVGFELLDFSVAANFWAPKSDDMDKIIGLLFTVGYRIGLF
ncbi:MAG: hypothetical protein GYA21_02910 [Myxococcales bacterium]|nr:hypothetical protein [Myxococcales bacterium]